MRHNPAPALTVALVCASACWLAGASAQAAESGDAPPLTAVRTRPDPFQRLRTIDEGRIASSWSSLPSGSGCGDAYQQAVPGGHAQMLAQSNAAGQEASKGSFDLIEPRYRVQLDGTANVGCVFGQVAVQRQAGEQGDFWSLDGSALSWRIDDHWRLGVGLIARQWGPAWDGSLILGTAGRPFANGSVDAASGPLTRSSFWWWLGEVDFSAFFGELEGDRGDYARPYLMGTRLVIRPWPSLELGASRTAMWGGEGRDNSWQAFWKAVFGRDNRSGRGSEADEPGNQLGGFDARWNLSAWAPGVALYGQMIGEDEATGLPSKYMYQAGIDWRRDGDMAFLEWTDSTAKLTGVAYNHSIFTDGYRYKGSPLGYWADGDSNVWAVGSLLKDLAGGQALALARYGTLNNAGTNPTWSPSRLVSASIQWRTAIDRVFGLTVVVDHLNLTGRQAAGGPSADTQRDTKLRVQLDAWLN